MAEPSEPSEPKKKPPKKADNATIAQRVEEVLRIRLDGAQFHDIVQYAAEKLWGVNERQLWNYIARADKLLVERLDRNRKRTVARHVAMRESLYARAVNAADLRTALATLADLAKLRGLYPEREVKELKRLAAAQGLRLEELERRLHAAGLSTYPTRETSRPAPLSLEETKRIARAAAAEALAACVMPPLPPEPPMMDEESLNEQSAVLE